MDVSIIITTYNRLWCLPRAIESCRVATCSTQIIVVDDGSNDGTWEWLQKQPDITSIQQPNQGQCYALNAGIALATGKYIRFLDSDDYLEEGTIDKQFTTADENDADLVYGRVDLFDQSSGKIISYPEIIPWADFMEVQLSNRYGSHFLGMLFRTAWVRKVPRRPDYALREDRMFLLEYGLLNPVLAFTGGCMGYWVQHSGQMQGNYDGLRAQVANWQALNIFRNILHHLEERGELTQVRKNAACTSLWPLATWIAKNHLREAFELYKWILQLNPDFSMPENGILGQTYKMVGFNNTQRLLALRRWLTGRK